MGLVAVFQAAQDILFDTVERVMGQDATWKASGKQDETALVLFNDPTKSRRFQMVNGSGLSHVAYENGDVVDPYIEYRKGQFPGLFEKVTEDLDDLQYIETGGKLYVCKHLLSMYDGQTYRIQLQLSDANVSMFNL